MKKTGCGNLFIVAAPSGGGKTSLVKTLVEQVANLDVSISHTTRKQRPGEVEGKDYFFISVEIFNQMVTRGEFVEHACVFNHHYGTAASQIHQRLQSGRDVVLDIDWQGAQQIKQHFPDAVGIFIIPPSLTALKERLLARRQDNNEVIHTRMQRAQDELSHYKLFDFLIVNDDFDKASAELQSIVIAERLTMRRQVIAQQKLLSFLLASQ